MSGTTPRRRHGPAGLLVVLFVVGGLIFSYGLRHGPVERLCTEHAVSVPVAAASAVTGHHTPGPGGSALHGLHSLSDTVLTAPLDDRPAPPLDACLCLAALFTLVLLGLALALRRPATRLPARTGWTPVRPAAGASAPAFPPPLQVLRL
ncbi:hypothetical protein E1264_26695 [Actinomadura sp. KC216]|uniref:hypothetical protein n=1 Tax=Actinomadura sp. KC216 TaxID=2530370 RepID=UPI001050F5A8|nr:hypothetical protein [Actinomadura sp. KC216]TDB83899.1 hypothetical protein E1264_26695 [Actinomadura sp. KC216]